MGIVLADERVVMAGPAIRQSDPMGPFTTAVVAAAVLACVGCGGASDDSEPAALDPASSGSYCALIGDVVGMSVEDVRADRAAYRDAVAAVAAESPEGHRVAWASMLEFVDDDSSERLNPAADGLDRIGSDIERDCGIDLVLVDWDVLQDQSGQAQPDDVGN
jgi:hypothetical protein